MDDHWFSAPFCVSNSNMNRLVYWVSPLLKHTARRLKLRFLCLVILLSVSFDFCHAGTPSQEALESFLQKFCSDELEGRLIKQDSGKEACLMLETWLKENQIQPLGAKDGSYLQPFSDGSNLIGVVYPKGQEGKAPKILLTAHYDQYFMFGRPDKAEIENGAADNAAGVAVVLFALKAAAQHIQAPVAVALWSGRSCGEEGSLYFANNPTFPLEELGLMIEVDIVGLTFYPGFEKYTFAYGADSGGEALLADISEQSHGLKLLNLSQHIGRNWGRATSSFHRFKKPHVLFTDGRGSVDKSKYDKYESLDLAKVHLVQQMITNLTIAASKPERNYVYSLPDKSSLEDAYTLDYWLSEVRAFGAANNMDQATLVKLRKRMRTVKSIIDNESSSYNSYTRDSINMVEEHSRSYMYKSKKKSTK